MIILIYIVYEIIHIRISTRKLYHSIESMDIYGFKCDCALCKLDEKDPMRMMGSQLLMQVDAKASDKKTGLNEILKYVEKIRETYVKRRNCQIELIHAMDSLAQKYRDIKDYDNSSRLFEEMFELIKCYNDFYAVNCLKEALIDFKKMNDLSKIEVCRERAFEYFENINMDSGFYEKLWNKIENFKD
jgi:tetratricopeptide (TPR) repeat protein